MALTVSATAMERSTGAVATTSLPLRVTVTAVNDAPTLALRGHAAPAAEGEASVDLVADGNLADPDSARFGGATITLTGGQPGDRLALGGHPLEVVDGRTRLAGTGIEVTVAGDTLTLRGAAPIATYEAVLEQLALENGAPSGLAAGARTIAIQVWDEAGATAATQSVTVAVTPSVLAGDGSARTLTGTAGHDTFPASAGDETMLGGAGADLFVIRSGGGRDHVAGGTGSWIDTIDLADAGEPAGDGAAGGWTLALEGGATARRNGQGFDLSEPASGSISFADGSVVTFAEIERISW
jgi:hypothetical protein